MIPLNKKGQIELSFQWIFAIIAGGTFLLIFFFILRGCTQTAEDTVSVRGIKSAASVIGSTAWQDETTADISVQQATVSCPAGVITLMSGPASASIDRVPAFLPPSLSGRLSLKTKTLWAAEQTNSPIKLGTIVYGFDENTYYLVVDGGNNYDKFIAPLGKPKNLKVLGDVTDVSAAVAAMPKTAKTVVVVTFDESTTPTPMPSSIPSALSVRGVFFDTTAGTMDFKKYSTSWNTGDSGITYINANLAAGAIVTGDYTLFSCAKEGLYKRLHFLTDKIYGPRLNAVLVSSVCAASINDAKSKLSVLNTVTDSDPEDHNKYLVALFNERGNLANAQASLVDQGCPVIA